MMSRLRLALVTAVLAGSMAGVAEAQTNRAHLGPRIGYNFEVEEVALGAQFSAPLGDRFEFYPSLDYYFVDPGSLWGFNLDLKYRLEPRLGIHRRRAQHPDRGRVRNRRF